MTKKQLRVLYRTAYGAAWFENPEVYACYKRGLPPTKSSAPAPEASRPKPPRQASRPKPPRQARQARQVPMTPAVPLQHSHPRPPHPPLPSKGPPKGVMLAKKWKGSDPTGWWMSEKLDGMRAYWTGSGLFTRNGNPIAAPSWFTDVLPRGVALDGELYMGRGLFQETISVTRKATGRDPRWDQVRYMAFDAPEVPGGCEQRFDVLRGIVKTACRNWTRSGPCPLVFVEQRKCSSKIALTRFHEEIEKLRGEGVMLRAPGSHYRYSRTGDLLKVKNFIDAEARIIGHTAGTGKHQGRLGAYQAELLESKTHFKVGTGISDYERDHPKRAGTIITVRFQEYTKAGVPRFPSLIGARDYE
jgi:DNA ligase 1